MCNCNQPKPSQNLNDKNFYLAITRLLTGRRITRQVTRTPYTKITHLALIELVLNKEGKVANATTVKPQ